MKNIDTMNADKPRNNPDGEQNQRMTTDNDRYVRALQLEAAWAAQETNEQEDEE